jgi:hypothetical protein
VEVIYGYQIFLPTLWNSFLYNLILCRCYLLLNFPSWTVSRWIRIWCKGKVLSRVGFICGSCVYINYKFVWRYYCFISCNLIWCTTSFLPKQIGIDMRSEQTEQDYQARDVNCNIVGSRALFTSHRAGALRRSSDTPDQ